MTSDVPGTDPSAAEHDPLREQATRLRSLVDLSGARPLTVVVDTAGADERLVLAVLGTQAGLPLDVITLRPASPGVSAAAADPADLTDLQVAVVANGADLGLALDAVGERCVVVDDRGVTVDPSVTFLLLGVRLAASELVAGRTPAIVHDAVTSRAVPDLLRSAGARTVRAAAGHASVVAQMVEHDAVLGGESDARYTFRGLGTAPSGLVAALHLLAAVGGQPHPLSVLAELYQPYVGSGEVAVPVVDVQAARERVVHAYVEQQGGGRVDVDELDGLTVSHWDGHPQWWFNLRASDDGTALRLVVEAADEDMMVKVRDDVLALVRSDEEI